MSVATAKHAYHFLTQHRRWAYIAAVTVLLLFIPVAFSHAQILDSLGAGVINAFTALVSLINRILLWVMQAMQAILDYVLGVQFNHGLYRNVPAVTVGWKLIRDLVNMFFIIGLLIIAFATMLRIESYGMRQALPRFIAAALLVNFSLVLPIIVVDVSNLLLYFFSKVLVGKNILLILLSASKVWTIVSANAQGFLPQTSSSQLATIDLGRELMLAVFLLFFLYAAVVMVGMLVVRVVALWVILIMAPLAVLASIFPFSKNIFDTWLKQLFSWSFLAPTMAFFMYLSVQIASTLNLATFTTSLQGPSSSAFAFLSSPQNILSYIVIVVFMYASVYMAKTSSATGASIVAGKLAGYALKAGAFASGVGYLRRRYQERKKINEDIRRDARKVRREQSYAGAYGGSLRDKAHLTRAGREAAQRKRAEMLGKEAERIKKQFTTADKLDVDAVKRVAEQSAITPAERGRRAAALMLLAEHRAGRSKESEKERKEAFRGRRPTENALVEARLAHTPEVRRQAAGRAIQSSENRKSAAAKARSEAQDTRKAIPAPKKPFSQDAQNTINQGQSAITEAEIMSREAQRQLQRAMGGDRGAVEEAKRLSRNIETIVQQAEIAANQAKINAATWGPEAVAHAEANLAEVRAVQEEIAATADHAEAAELQRR